MKPSTVASRDQGSRAATTIAIALAGAAIGACIGWGVAEVGIQGGSVSTGDETRYFISSVLILGAIGGLIGAGLGAVVGRSHRVVRVRTLLRATALAILLVGLVFALFLNHGCHAWVPTDEPGVPAGLSVRCVEPDQRVPMRLAIGIGAAVVALTLLILERVISARGSAGGR
jgi:hypothetical protein